MTTYCSSSSVFMTNKTPNGMRKHCEGSKPGTRKTGEIFFFLSFFFFRQASSVLSESLTMVLVQNSSILHWAVHFPQLQCWRVCVWRTAVQGRLFHCHFHCQYSDLCDAVAQASRGEGMEGEQRDNEGKEIIQNSKHHTLNRAPQT